MLGAPNRLSGRLQASPANQGEFRERLIDKPEWPEAVFAYDLIQTGLTGCGDKSWRKALEEEISSMTEAIRQQWYAGGLGDYL